MKAQLVVRIEPDASLASKDFRLEWAYAGKDEANEAEIYSGSLQELAEWQAEQSLDDQDLPIVVLVPGSLASTHRQELTENQRKHWQQALPFLLEEKLASELESQFLVSALDASGETARCSCINHWDMAQIIEQFVPAGVNPQKVVAETQLFKGENGVLSIWLEGSYALLARGEHYAQLLDTTSLDVIIPSLLDDETHHQEDDIETVDENGEHQPPSAELIAAVRIYAGAGDKERYSELAEHAGKSVPVVLVERQSDSLFPDEIQRLTEAMAQRALLDFRTGNYKCTRRTSRRLRQWKPVALTASVWLGLELLFNISSGFYFSYRADQLHSENLELYHELRPGDRTVVDVRDRLTKFLRSANTRQNDAVFLGVLQTLSRISDGEVGKSIKPLNMDFNETSGRLSLDVRAVSFDLLNRYLEELRTAGLNARMETGNQDAQGVSAKLTVRNA